MIHLSSHGYFNWTRPLITYLNVKNFCQSVNWKDEFCSSFAKLWAAESLSQNRRNRCLWIFRSHQKFKHVLKKLLRIITLLTSVDHFQGLLFLIYENKPAAHACQHRRGELVLLAENPGALKEDVEEIHEVDDAGHEAQHAQGCRGLQNMHALYWLRKRKRRLCCELLCSKFREWLENKSRYDIFCLGRNCSLRIPCVVCKNSERSTR